jgi:hypothetical protein
VKMSRIFLMDVNLLNNYTSPQLQTPHLSYQQVEG